MKKYLISGAIILASTGLLVSCSHEEEYTGSIAESKVQAFEELFASEFGTIDPNQDWGFSSTTTSELRSRTRGADERMNMWAGLGYTVPKELTTEQKKRVIAYFQNNRLSDGGEKDWTDFFVQQVYKGGENVNILNSSNPLTAENYQSLSMSKPAYGSSKMEKLYANGSEHISNYNNASCQTYTNVQNSAGVSYLSDHGNGTHTDQIQLMVNSAAKDFGYKCSEISKNYSDHYSMVDGSVIDQWAKTSGNNIGESVTGLAFVGFDFDLLTPDAWYTNPKTKFKMADIDPNITSYYSERGGEVTEWPYVNSDYTDKDGNYIYYLQNNYNMMSGTLVKNIHNKLDIDDAYKVTKVLGIEIWSKYGKKFKKYILDNYIEEGYRPISNYNWVKPEVTRDYYYSDWIICISPAVIGLEPPSLPVDNSETTTTYSNTTTTTEEYQEVELVECGRVFCEDLGKVDNNDLDFNDVVFDAYVYKTTYSTRTIVETDGVKIIDNEETTGTEYNTYIYLLAAGGTMPLEVAGFEVHNAFGGAGTTTIINTITNSEESYGNAYISCNPVKLEGTFDYQHIKDIPIYVWFKSNNEVFQLQSNLGEAPHKICVPIGTPWCLERKQLKETYKNFGSYVSNSSFDCWSTENNKDYIVTANLFGNLTYDAPGVTTGKTRIGEPEVTTSTSGSSTTTGGYGGGTVLSRER